MLLRIVLKTFISFFGSGGVESSVGVLLSEKRSVRVLDDYDVARVPK
jgi:hypothetical protein